MMTRAQEDDLDESRNGRHEMQVSFGQQLVGPGECDRIWFGLFCDAWLIEKAGRL